MSKPSLVCLLWRLNMMTCNSVHALVQVTEVVTVHPQAGGATAEVTTVATSLSCLACTVSIMNVSFRASYRDCRIQNVGPGHGWGSHLPFPQAHHPNLMVDEWLPPLPHQGVTISRPGYAWSLWWREWEAPAESPAMLPTKHATSYCLG